MNQVSVLVCQAEVNACTSKLMVRKMTKKETVIVVVPSLFHVVVVVASEMKRGVVVECGHGVHLVVAHRALVVGVHVPEVTARSTELLRLICFRRYLVREHVCVEVEREDRELGIEVLVEWTPVVLEWV